MRQRSIWPNMVCVVAAMVLGLSAVTDTLAQTKAKMVSPKKPLVGVYYYPWYEAPHAESDNGEPAAGWLRKSLRGRLQPKHWPKLGVYDSRKAETIGDHIAQSQRGGIDFWTVSWWGPHDETDTIFGNHILRHPDAGKLKYALFYEATGRLGSFSRPNYSRLVNDFKYMRDNYFDNKHYLKIKGKPVVFIYLTRVYFRDQGLDALRRLREELPELFLVGDDVFGPEYHSKYARLWDAVTAYDGYGQSLKDGGATRAAVEQLKANYANARKISNDVETGFVPGVCPGYNDKAVRRGHPGRARYFEDKSGSQEGDVFREMLRDVALPLLDPLADNMMMVTSFNEWYEDTQIEATAGTAPSTTKDDSQSGTFYTEGDSYTDYGYLYLDILREETEPGADLRKN